jgi:UDP-2,3-diacylglucosamine pyrophosphatase LpxH
MRSSIVLVILAVACGGTHRANAVESDPLAERVPLARLDDRALCDRLLARREEDYAVTVDAEPRTRRKVIVSDLHLGPGTTDPRFAGIEDFYADAEWAAFLEREGAGGPIDLIVAGDFVEFWQLAAVLGALPRLEDRAQPAGTVLGADQAFAAAAIELVIAAHPTVFRALGRLLDGGDHRVILIAGNHDADLLWPKVQLAIARAIAPRDPARLVFVQGAAYQHAGTYVAHGHAYDAANRYATGHAPFGRDRDGRCRLQTSWGEVFVDRFYTETERQIPFIDNLYPESAAILWALRDNPDAARDLGAAVRALDMLRAAQGRGLNRDAIGAVLQSALGIPGARGGGPASTREVLDHVTDRLTRGDAGAAALATAMMRLANDPDLAQLRRGLVGAAAALPDVSAALRALGGIDPGALSKLQATLFGDPLETAARALLDSRGVDVVVLGHTHSVGGLVQRIASRTRAGHYANTGSWISVASVAELRAHRIGWDQLSLADRATFPSKRTAVIVAYQDGAPLAPIVQNAADPPDR